LVLTFAAVPDIAPSHVSFEILGADGEWSACTSTEEEIEAVSRSEHETSDTRPPESLAEDNSHDPNLRPGTFAIVPTEAVLDDFTIDALPQDVSQDLDISGTESMYYGQLDSLMTFTPEVDLQTVHETWNYSPDALEFAPFYYDALRDLPFKRFQNELKKKGVYPVHYLCQLLFVLIFQALTSGVCALQRRR
jgi:hypothetical protein